MRNFIVLLIVTLSLMACGGNQQVVTTPEQQAALANLAGFNTGYILAKNKPEMAKAAIPYCDNILAAQDAGAMQLVIDTIIPLMKDQEVAGLIAYNVTQMSKILGVNIATTNPVITAQMVPFLKEMAAGFKAGAAIGTPK